MISISTDAKTRKDTPICTGVLDYFPLAMAEIARVSKAGNDQHNPGEPLHWAREKSTDHADCVARHLLDRGKRDIDGQRHSGKMAWRALALLQTEMEEEANPMMTGTTTTDGFIMGPVSSQLSQPKPTSAFSFTKGEPIVDALRRAAGL